jgi:hypothetical protein
MTDARKELLSIYKPKDTSENNSTLEKEKRSLEILRQSLRQLQEMEEIGNDTHQKLKDQTKQIQDATDKTGKIKDDLSYSNKLLNRMSKWWRG